MDDTLGRAGRYRFGDIYANYLAKVERKGRSQGELDGVLTWLTGHTTDGLHAAAESEETLAEFVASAPRLNPHATLITGVVCGVRVEEITDPLMQRIRWMDKVVDELARGKKIENILRSPR